MNVGLVLITIVSFISQIVFSFYYSVTIVNLSNQVNELQTKIEIEKSLLQSAKINYENKNSLHNIEQSLILSPHLKITKSITIK